MASTAFSRPLSGALQPVTHAQSFFEKPASFPFVCDATRRCLSFQDSGDRQKLVLSKSSKRALSCVKATKTAPTMTLDAVTTESASQGLSQAKSVQNSTFPSGFEALVLGVCDETEIAEVKLKVGQFEMHLKRDIKSPAAAAPIAAPVAPPVTASPAPTKAKVESAPAVSQKSTTSSTNPFANTASTKAPKLAALEASGSNTYVLVSSPTVGTFRSGRTVKGKKQPPSCKEGDMIKEGQVIGYLDQFGSELPVRAGVAGEVLKVLYKDGEPVGYGDSLVAVLPSFRGIK